MISPRQSRALFLLAVLCAFSLSTLAAPPGEAKTAPPATSDGAASHTIRIKALIDGADTIKVQGNRIWYEHESWDLPGKWQGRDEPTLINGVAWRPDWLGEASTNNCSDPYLDLQPPFPDKTPDDIKLTTIAGRGGVQIAQWPRADNHHTLAIHLDDSDDMGADWYEVAIAWTQNAVTNVIKIKALIDGADLVKIQGNRIWYEHESWDLPGKWQGRDEPTFINDKPWHPVWHNFDDQSKPFENLQPAFAPKNPATIKLTKVAARGPVEITQLPSPTNNQTLSFRLDDSSPADFPGADWYEVTIDWQ